MLTRPHVWTDMIPYTAGNAIPVPLDRLAGVYLDGGGNFVFTPEAGTTNITLTAPDASFYPVAPKSISADTTATGLFLCVIRS